MKSKIIVAITIVLLGIFALPSVDSLDIKDELVSTPLDWGEELAKEVEVKLAYNEVTLLMQFEWPDKIPNVQHDMLVYRGGEWVKEGAEPKQHKYQLTEDRITLQIDDGSVRGFPKFGCFVTCHADMRDTYATPSDEEIKAHPYVGGVKGATEVLKYIPESRQKDEWYGGTWDAITPEDKGRIALLKNNSVFIDMWMWRAARSNPLGWADDLIVLDSRDGDKGKSMFGTNFDGAKMQPRYMFDEKKEGFVAFNWEDVVNRKVSSYMILGENTAPFDPNRQWKEGDTIPRRFLQTPDGSRADVKGSGVWQNDKWTVTMERKLNTGNVDDKVLLEGRTYYVGIAVHDHGTEARWHYVSLPLAVSMGTPGGDIVAKKFSGDGLNWDTIEATKVMLFYPGETTWEFLISNEHPGSRGIKMDGVGCEACHRSDDLVKLSYGLELTHRLEGNRMPTWIAGFVLLFCIAGVGVILGRR